MSDDPKAEARIAAANVIAEINPALPIESYELLVALVGLGWLSGYRTGTQRTLEAVSA